MSTSTIDRDVILISVARVGPATKAMNISNWPVDSIPSTAKLAAGILPFFDEGDTILLSKEFLEECGTHFWVVFCGIRQNSESPSETACREANEETAGVLDISMRQVEEAEQRGYFIDYYDEKTDFFYRMYCVVLDTKPSIEKFIQSVDMEEDEWGYFPTKDVIHNTDGSLSGTDTKLYGISIRIEMP